MEPRSITEKLNFVPVKLLMTFRETELAIGTGFFYRLGDSTHLVTTWHNVTGRHPETDKALHSQSAIPDTLRIYFPIDVKVEGDKRTMRLDQKILPLYEDDEMKRPIWQEHPSERQRIDVVSIPISELETTAFYQPTIQL